MEDGIDATASGLPGSSPEARTSPPGANDRADGKSAQTFSAQLRASEEKTTGLQSDKCHFQWEDYVLPGLDLLEEKRTESRYAAGLGELKRIEDEIGDTVRALDIAAFPGPIAQGTAAIGFHFQLERVPSSSDVRRLERLLAHTLDVDWVELICDLTTKQSSMSKYPMQAGQTSR